MYALYASKKLIGYMSLPKESDDTYELHKLAVLQEYRHKGFGKLLLDYAKDVVKASGGIVIKIGIIEESTVLKNWYIANGFVQDNEESYRTGWERERERFRSYRQKNSSGRGAVVAPSRTHGSPDAVSTALMGARGIANVGNIIDDSEESEEYLNAGWFKLLLLKIKLVFRDTRGENHIPEIPKHIRMEIARCFMPDIITYFESEEGHKEFEEWKKTQNILNHPSIDSNKRA